MNLLGSRFGRLVVESLSDKRYRRAKVWICKCDCGNSHEVTTYNLTSGSIQSCGCLLEDTARTKGISNRTEMGLASFNLLYGQYKRNALARRKEFSLSKEDFKNIVSKDCYYCGVKPQKTKRHSRIYGVFFYNGIDRVDNSKGYTVDNVVPCCTTCNKAKLQMTEEEFLAWIGRVYEHRCKT